MKSDNKERKYSDAKVLGILLRFAKPYRFQLILGIFLTMVTVMINLLPAYVQGEIIGILDNPAFSSQDKLTRTLILIAAFMGIVVIGIGISYVGGMLIQNVGQKILVGIRRDVFLKIE